MGKTRVRQSIRVLGNCIERLMISKIRVGILHMGQDKRLMPFIHSIMGSWHQWISMSEPQNEDAYRSHLATGGRWIKNKEGVVAFMSCIQAGHHHLTWCLPLVNCICLRRSAFRQECHYTLTMDPHSRIAILNRSLGKLGQTSVRGGGSSHGRIFSSKFTKGRRRSKWSLHYRCLH